ncbi:MAG: Fic family protein [Acidobacteria bacterium]|nr:Fic family protein [Acidobacteriota bacterium]
MQLTDFTKDMWGEVGWSTTGYHYFVPGPLPPLLIASWELTQRLSQADRAVSELSGTARNLPNPHLLIGPFIRREAVLSSRIEGTEASLSDLFFFEAAGPAWPTGERPADVVEVANYVRAMEYGLKRLKELPLSLRLIRELHGKLMEGVRGDRLTPGQFRRSQNWIGPAGCTLADATYVPPPVREMNEALDRFEKYLHQESPLPPLIRMALVHYQFEAIHPFLDGNGRIGRLLISLLLCHEGLLAQPLLYLSAYFEQNRQEYYRRLLAVSQSGQWSEWIHFFLTGVARQSRDAIWRTGKLLDLWQSYRRKFQLARSSALLMRLVDGLFESPVISISRAAARLGVTHRSATLNIQKMVDTGILTEVTGRERYRLFLARGILSVIEEERKEGG